MQKIRGQNSRYVEIKATYKAKAVHEAKKNKRFILYFSLADDIQPVPRKWDFSTEKQMS